MTNKMIFNVDSSLKERAMKQAREDGVPFSTVLRLATKAYAEGRLRLAISENLVFNEKTRNEIERALKDIRAGKNLSPAFTNAKDAIVYLKR